ncbi:hypothetical protein GCM10022226_19990 [Sphaerisporangium flaviroseum]|uniref:Histidine kinase/HSP90-like ATPase domain-containing protein n=1 Tax=Sphaerisporangium flaviroseum TaxID=509199 RepID=A0ABP7HNI0_9ACTN
MGDDTWEGWLAALDHVLSPAGPWAVEGGDQNPERLQLALCELRHDRYAARTARGFTTTTLRSWGLDELVDDAELVIGELVINALRHGLGNRATVFSGHPVRIILALTDESLICVVTDPSDECPTPRDPDFGSEGGRGLQVVAGISHRWGWAPLGSPGKAVWAGFTLPGSSPHPVRHLEICY